MSQVVGLQDALKVLEDLLKELDYEKMQDESVSQSEVVQSNSSVHTSEEHS